MAEVVDTSEFIKLFRNSKGYNWEIKIRKDDNHSFDNILEQLDKIDLRLRSTYGQPISLDE